MSFMRINTNTATSKSEQKCALTTESTSQSATTLESTPTMTPSSTHLKKNLLSLPPAILWIIKTFADYKATPEQLHERLFSEEPSIDKNQDALGTGAWNMPFLSKSSMLAFLEMPQEQAKWQNILIEHGIQHDIIDRIRKNYGCKIDRRGLAARVLKLERLRIYNLNEHQLLLLNGDAKSVDSWFTQAQKDKTFIKSVEGGMELNPLSYVILSGNVEAYRAANKIFQHKANTPLDNQGRTPLMYAAYSGNSAMMQEIITEVGREIIRETIDSEHDKLGRRVLHYACWSGSRAAIKIACIDLCAVLEIEDSVDRYPSHYVSWSGSWLEIDEDYDFKSHADHGGRMPLCYEFMNGNEDSVNAFLTSERITKQVDYALRRLVIHDTSRAVWGDYVALSGNHRAITLYLHGYDKIIRPTPESKSARIDSPRSYSERDLVGAYRDYRKGDIHGRTLLHNVAKSGNVKAIATVLEYKGYKDFRFNIQDRDKEGLTMLHFAARSGNPEAIKFCQARGVNASDIKILDEILHCAKASGNSSAVNYVKGLLPPVANKKKSLLSGLNIFQKFKKKTEESPCQSAAKLLDDYAKKMLSTDERKPSVISLAQKVREFNWDIIGAINYLQVGKAALINNCTSIPEGRFEIVITQVISILEEGLEKDKKEEEVWREGLDKFLSRDVAGVVLTYRR